MKCLIDNFWPKMKSKSCSNQLQVKCGAGAVLSVEGRAVVLLSKSLSTSPEVYECLISCLSVITSDTWNTSLISIDTFLKHCGSTLQCFSKRQSNGSEKSEQYLNIKNKNNSIFTTVFFFKQRFCVAFRCVEMRNVSLRHVRPLEGAEEHLSCPT